MSVSSQLILRKEVQEFPGSPVVRTPHSHCQMPWERLLVGGLNSHKLHWVQPPKMKTSGWIGRGSGGLVGSGEWVISKRLSRKAGVKPEESQWEASTGCGDSSGIQVGSPGDSRIGRSSSRPHKPCSKQAKLSGSHIGSSSRMEALDNVSSMRPSTAVWELTREGLSSD